VRRLVLGVLLGGFLTLIGLQAAHTHKTVKTDDPCAVCALAQQAARQAPKAVPTISVPHAVQDLVVAALASSRSGAVADLRARAPPAAA